MLLSIVQGRDEDPDWTTYGMCSMCAMCGDRYSKGRLIWLIYILPLKELTHNKIDMIITCKIYGPLITCV